MRQLVRLLSPAQPLLGAEGFEDVSRSRMLAAGTTGQRQAGGLRPIGTEGLPRAWACADPRRPDRSGRPHSIASGIASPASPG